MSMTTDRRLRGIVVGVDGSEQPKRALRWAARQAHLTEAGLNAVIAWQFPTSYGYVSIDVDWDENARSVLNQAVNDAVGGTNAEQVYQHVVEGHPASVLLNAAADADLLVVGSRGHRGFVGMLPGSVSQHVVTHARCSVVVVHGTTSDQTRA
jgi:nucleotide-binding universal stress UspA family protein